MVLLMIQKKRLDRHQKVIDNNTDKNNLFINNPYLTIIFFIPILVIECKDVVTITQTYHS